MVCRRRRHSDRDHGDEVDHLRKGERDHDEVDPARAQRERADGEREQRRCEERDRPLQEARADAFIGKNADA